MKINIFPFKFVVIISLCFIFSLPCLSQMREYYIYGNVIDENNLPIPKLQISLRDVKTSRSYSFKTNKKGLFKFIGLPHGIYKVTLQKKGYQTVTTEWKFKTKQDRMQKVKIETIKMYSEGVVKEIKLAKKLKAKIEKAKEKIQKRDFDDAIDILKEMLTDKPNEVNALYLMGICYLKKNMIIEAINNFTKVTASNPSFVGGHFQLGICLQKQKELDKALFSYKKALELDPKNLVSLYNSGLIHYEKNKPTKAIKYFEKALESKSDDPEILESAGLCYIHLEKYKKAIEYLKKAKGASKNEEKAKFLDELIKDLKKQIKKQ